LADYRNVDMPQKWMLVVRDVDLRCFIQLPYAKKLPQWVPTYPQKSF